MGIVKPVVIVGPMGVGKTTIGKKLAKRLELPFIDTDLLVMKKHGSIESIFDKFGEATFREFETTELLEALKVPAVIATGGGAVLSEANRQALRLATVIYLSTNGKHIRSRLAHGNRPLLKNGFSDWQRIYDERRPLYEAVADLTVDTSTSGLADTIGQICEKLDKL